MAQGGGERRKGLFSYFSSASVEVKHSIRRYRSQLFVKEENRRNELKEEPQQKIEQQKEEQLKAGQRQQLQPVESEDCNLADLHDRIAQFRLSTFQGASPIDDETQQATGEPYLKAARELYDGNYSTVPAHKAARMDGQENDDYRF